ncbi:TPA: hypothetical protein ACPSKZ_000701 [Legionella anisa]|uniref:hypothetical protein n=1 Tax=Legionella anisa TaxID=28082 RepID=UPI0022444730|nr:hypothetical protein [Legionella anisa]MCW8425601.1 hypothetical protein [Legionella anisa]MCW8448969.1 hypothetical protein [Legionella anisa]
MIDYEKLKLAHELLKKIPDKKWFFRQYSTEYFDHEDSSIDEVSYVLCHQNEYDEEFKYIEDLITKLRELTQKPKPKYEVGQEVWFLYGNATESFIIKDMTGDPLKLWSNDGFCIYEEICYASRESLIEAQIEYWESLRKDKRPFEQILYDESKKMKWAEYWDSYKDCEHESDGKFYWKSPI